MKTSLTLILVADMTWLFCLSLDYGIEKTFREPTRTEMKTRQLAMATRWRAPDVPVTMPEEYRNVKLQRRSP